MRHLKVLVVDDDPDFAEGLALALEIAGHRVETAASGSEAVAKFRSADFDITFMDVRMPGMSGVDSFLAFRRIKPNARVVMMTAYGLQDQLRVAVDAGALDVMQKPFTGDELLRMVERVRPAGIVLLADDDQEFAEAIEAALAPADYAVTVVHTGQHALDAVLAGGIDVMILDVRLPDLNGREVYRQLLDRGRTVPTIVVTGFAAEEEGNLEALRAMSVEGTLLKPFDTERLLRAIDGIVRGSANGGL